MAGPDLRLDWATYEAAKYACRHWHYAGKIPRAKLVRVGVWEDGSFRGVVIFSYGATPKIGSPFGLRQTEVCELTRIALRRHRSPVSRIIKIALKFLKESNPGIKLVVSFADTEQGHHGGIYQASNWIYAGTTKPGRVGFVIKGEKVHTRTIGARGGVQSLRWVRENLDPRAEEWLGSPKHRYLMPLDEQTRERVRPLSRPYPKREK